MLTIRQAYPTNAYIDSWVLRAGSRVPEARSLRPSHGAITTSWLNLDRRLLRSPKLTDVAEMDFFKGHQNWSVWKKHNLNYQSAVATEHKSKSEYSHSLASQGHSSFPLSSNWRGLQESINWGAIVSAINQLYGNKMIKITYKCCPLFITVVDLVYLF